MSGRTNGHKSHIGSRGAVARGWSSIPSWSVRQETLNLIEEGGFMADSYGSLTVSNVGDGSAFTYADSTTATGDYHYWVGDWGFGYYPPVERVVERVVETINKSEVTKMDLRTLFRVYVVNPKKNGKILINGNAVIAENENQAMLKVGVAEVATKEGVDIEDLDVYIEKVGTFIRPRKKTQKVQIVKEED